MSNSKIEPLIDLAKYSTDEVNNIGREFLRNVYLDVIDECGKETDKDKIDNYMEIIKSIEIVIIVLEEGEEFLKYVNAENGIEDGELIEEKENDDPFDL